MLTHLLTLKLSCFFLWSLLAVPALCLSISFDSPLVLPGLPDHGDKLLIRGSPRWIHPGVQYQPGGHDTETPFTRMHFYNTDGLYQYAQGDHLLEFLGMMGMGGGAVARETDSESKDVYVYTDRDGVVHRITREELRLWYALYHEQQLERLIFGDRLPAGGGVPPEQWAMAHRLVPWSQRRILARLINEHREKLESPKVRRTPVGKNDEKENPGGARESGHQFSEEVGSKGFNVQPVVADDSTDAANRVSASLPTATRHQAEEKMPESTEDKPEGFDPDKLLPVDAWRRVLTYITSRDDLRNLRAVHSVFTGLVGEQFAPTLAAGYLQTLPEPAREQVKASLEQVFTPDICPGQMQQWLERCPLPRYDRALLSLRQDKPWFPLFVAGTVNLAFDTCSLSIVDQGVIRQRSVEPEHFSSDGQYFVSFLYGEGTNVTAYTLTERGEWRDEAQLPHEGVIAAAFSPRGLFLVTASRVSVKIWRKDASGLWEEINRIELSINRIPVFTPDGKKLALASYNHRISSVTKVLESGESDQWREVLHIEHSNAARQNHLVFSPNGQYLAIALANGTTQVWRSSHREAWLKIAALHLPGQISDMAFSPDSHYLATEFIDPGGHQSAGPGPSPPCSVQIWELGPETVHPHLAEWIKLKWNAKALEFSPDGRYLLVAGHYHDIAQLWRLDEGKWRLSKDIKPILTKKIQLVIPPEHNQEHTAFLVTFTTAFSPNSKYLAISSASSTTAIFSLMEETPELVMELQHDGLVQTLAFNPVTNSLAVKSNIYTLSIWHPSGEGLSPWSQKGHFRKIVDHFLSLEERVIFDAAMIYDYPWQGSLVFSPSGRHLMASGYPNFKKALRLEVIPDRINGTSSGSR